MLKFRYLKNVNVETDYVDKYLLHDLELLQKYEQEFVVNKNSPPYREKLEKEINNNLNDDSKVFAFIIFKLTGDCSKKFIDSFIIKPQYFHTEHFARRILNAVLHINSGYSEIGYFLTYWENICIDFFNHPEFISVFSRVEAIDRFDNLIKKFRSLGWKLDDYPNACLDILRHAILNVDDPQALVKKIQLDYSIDLVDFIKSQHVEIFDIDFTDKVGFAKLCYDFKSDLDITFIFNISDIDQLICILEYVTIRRGKQTIPCDIVKELINKPPEKFAKIVELIEIDYSDNKNAMYVDDIKANLNLLMKRDLNAVDMSIACMAKHLSGKI